MEMVEEKPAKLTLRQVWRLFVLGRKITIASAHGIHYHGYVDVMPSDWDSHEVLTIRVGKKNTLHVYIRVLIPKYSQ